MHSTNNNSKTAGNSRPQIFVVDDEPMLLELAIALLKPYDLDVKTFERPQDALKAFESSKVYPALIITDYAMAGMNGLDLIRECRRIHPSQKIILLSGTVNEAVYRDASAKPDAFIAKPYSAQHFLDLIQAALKC